jgi:sporulation protein YlmC with PRC-barrel domain
MADAFLSRVELLDHSLRCAVLALAFAILDLSSARAGLVAECDEPMLFGGAAVNVVILPYTYLEARQAELSEPAQTVAMLLKLDILATARFGSLGVVRLKPSEDPKGCNPDLVLDRLRSGPLEGPFGTPAPGSGIVVLWGRFFESGESLYVQSYLSFFRHRAEESIPIGSDSERIGSVEARFPSQQFAFAPRAISFTAVEGLVGAFSQVNTVRQAPHYSAPPVDLDLGSGDLFAFSVQGAMGGWLELRSFGPQPSGFVRLGAETEWLLKQVFPELFFIDGLIGYLTLRARHDSELPQFSMPDHASTLIEKSLASYRNVIEPSKERLPAGLSYTIAAAANVLEARYGLDDPHEAYRAARGKLAEAVLLLPDVNEVLTFSALVDLADPSGAYDARAVERLLSRALVAAPRDALALSNLGRLYEEQARQSDTVLPYSRGELTARAQAVARLSTPASRFYAMTPSDIIGLDIINERGESMGVVDDVVTDVQRNNVYALVSVGGFLGIGAREIVLPFEQIQVTSENELLIAGMTYNDLSQLPEYEASSYRSVDPNRPIGRERSRQQD